MDGDIMARFGLTIRANFPDSSIIIIEFIVKTTFTSEPIII